MWQIAGIILEEAELEPEFLWELKCRQGSEKELGGW
jgi:hypothetical protein